MLTKGSILIAQNKWAQGLIAIGKEKENPLVLTDLATSFINDLYAYKSEKVLFKPTKAKDIPFRLSFEAALSYFIGNNPNFSEDKGFALEPWADVQFKNNGFIFGESIALAMGHYDFTNTKGHTFTGEYSFGYKLNQNNELKIVLHHSSQPYSTLPI